jgi:hypothetical protein
MINMLILLLLWHALADFPLQGDFLAIHKDPTYDLSVPTGGKPHNYLWGWCMGAHCMIHAGGVYLITGAWQAAVFEFATHWVIDWTKCHGRISFNQDQVFHLIGKLIIVAWLVLR